MLDIERRAGIIFLDTFFDRAGNAARYRVTPARARCVVHFLFAFELLDIDIFRLENSGQFFKRQHEIHVASDRTAGSFQLFRRARPDEYNARLRVLFLDGARRSHHGRERVGNFIDGRGEIFFRQNRPRGTAGSEHERDFSRGDFFGVVFRFHDCAHVRAERYFVHFLESQKPQRRFDLARRGFIAELPHICGSERDDDFVAAF